MGGPFKDESPMDEKSKPFSSGLASFSHSFAIGVDEPFPPHVDTHTLHNFVRTLIILHPNVAPAFTFVQ